MASWRVRIPPYAAFPLAVFLALLNSCGGNSSNSLGTLQSVTVSPASATPGANGTVQFIATGHYVNPTSTETPLKVESPLFAGWSYTAEEADQKISLTQDGVATCTTPGTFVIAGWAERLAGPVCNAIGPGGAPCGSIAGIAHLTCP